MPFTRWIFLAVHLGSRSPRARFAHLPAPEGLLSAVLLFIDYRHYKLSTNTFASATATAT